jgi:hypothetical protein
VGESIVRTRILRTVFGHCLGIRLSAEYILFAKQDGGGLVEKEGRGTIVVDVGHAKKEH